MNFLLLSQNLPFTVSLAVMLGIALLEGVMTLLGAGLSNLLDTLIPDSLGEVDLEADVDLEIDADLGTDLGTGVPAHLDADVPAAAAAADGAHGASALSRLLGWLCVGRVPVLVLLIAFLTLFGLIGLALQGAVNSLLGFVLPGALAAVPALVLAVPGTRIFGLGMARVIPADETEAVSTDSFVGRVATITLGTARRGAPAQAKLTDHLGHAHYVMVEPDADQDSLSAGDEVLLISHVGATFRAIANTSRALTDG